MVATATAIYEKGVLRLLTPVSLPDRARVHLRIQVENKMGDELQRATAVLEASGLVKPPQPSRVIRKISSARRAELARMYGAAGTLSDLIMAERDAR
ncbi:antitoxin family protein [Candidatus Amarolinea dominans]|uniref:antitoxin family protein n=1 Tax=Candidatus Amarolinea dominans TaxID=3140696 RepID=UPI00313471C3|nr:antitoxin family protein [Anaerolineae bacterium]